MIIDTREWKNGREMAEIFGVTRAAISYNLKHHPEIRTIRLGYNTVLVSLSDYKEFYNNRWTRRDNNV